LKIVLGMATTNERLEYANRAIESIYKQVDTFHLYNNSEREDLTDNAKYYGLTIHQDEPIIYLTADDDIIYPEGYVDSIVNGIEKHGCIVSHHGRILKGLSKDYYRDHFAVGFFQESPKELKLDIYGDGVAGFRTDYFNPIEMVTHWQRMMADTLVSKMMWQQGKEAMLLKHEANWIKQQDVPRKLTISGTRFRRMEEKNRLADEIWLIKKIISSLIKN
jgi:hypothetical protein